MKPIPQSSEGKRQLFEQLKAQAPELLDAINTLRKQFPGCKVVALRLPDGSEYGEFTPEDEKAFALDSRFKTPAEIAADAAIRKAAESSNEAIKRERQRRKARK